MTRADYLRFVTRRQFLRRCGTGLGTIALAALLKENLFAAAGGDAAARPAHFSAKAKRVIYLHMAGAPSQLELFDYKPRLQEFDGQPCPAELIKGERFAFIKGVPNLLGTRAAFARHGQSGAELSEMLPHLAGVVDEIAIVKSMHTDQFNHAPAQLMVHTGSGLQGRPSMGSWITYGLGSENADLPGFVVLTSGGVGPDGGTALWNNGFLPSEFQGTQFRTAGDPVLFVSNPPGMSATVRRESLDALRDLNRQHLGEVGDPEILARIAQYELAYRMQTSVPELTDIAGESAATHALYGTEPGRNSFANNCLLARRLVERGVRFVQLYDWGWDSHGTSRATDIGDGLRTKCRNTDRASAALITDLKQRGLLDDTLVIWGGEFGRTPMNQSAVDAAFIGRDHHPRAFAIWMAGGGIKGGLTMGATDELGYNVVDEPVHVHDLQATILHCLGLDHTRLTYRHQGRDFRLTDVHGKIITKLLA